MGELRMTRRHVKALLAMQNKADKFLPLWEIPDGNGIPGRVSGKTLRELQSDGLVKTNSRGEFRITPDGFAALLEHTEEHEKG